MSIIKRYNKASTEIINYDIDFTAWLNARSLTIESFTISYATGLHIYAAESTGGLVRVLAGGGVSGTAYNLSANIIASDGQEKQGEITIRVRDYDTGTESFTGTVNGGGGGSVDSTGSVYLAGAGLLQLEGAGDLLEV